MRKALTKSHLAAGKNSKGRVLLKKRFSKLGTVKVPKTIPPLTYSITPASPTATIAADTVTLGPFQVIASDGVSMPNYLEFCYTVTSGNSSNLQQSTVQYGTATTYGGAGGTILSYTATNINAYCYPVAVSTGPTQYFFMRLTGFNSLTYTVNLTFTVKVEGVSKLVVTGLNLTNVPA